MSYMFQIIPRYCLQYEYHKQIRTYMVKELVRVRVVNIFVSDDLER